ncbi:MAG: leucine--tRNA ligase [Acidobacteriota bacterium]
MKPYDFRSLEARWQEFWQREHLFVAHQPGKGKDFYMLMMFPYPSGTLHVGHGRNYIIGDALCRFMKMRGFNVLAPMGWDAFGLPAENFAISQGIHPADTTRANIDRMREQFRKWGIGYDWDREIASSHPGFYRWTQWLFLQFYGRGLAYHKRADVNWCESCKTVLANEQVVEGACERCGHPVIQRELEQWFLKITDFAERLLDDLDRLEHWPERVKLMQANWIGRSSGVELEFPLERETGLEPLKVFTTRPDTVYGATFLALAPEHPRLKALMAGCREEAEVMDFAARARRQSSFARSAGQVEKEGRFTGRYAVNPFSGVKIPIWVANFVLTTYGTGAIMAVPAHDQRDFEFARSQDLPVRMVIKGDATVSPSEALSEAYTGDGTMIDSGPWSGLANRAAIPKMVAHAEKKGFGRAAVHYRLRDWLISRQRYWGTPIPIIYCEDCGEVPVPEKDLPVRLPRDVEFRPTGDSPLKGAISFVRTRCPTCSGAARRETDTMDTFVDSSWYYLRFVSPRLRSAPFDKADVNRWLPVDQYIGGIEHATLHLLYARFVTKFLHDEGYLKFSEPFERLFTQGMITAPAYRCPRHGWIPPSQVRDGCCAQDGARLEVILQKMAKSKLNVIPPAAIIEKFGADTERVFTLFSGPPEKEMEWSDDGVKGASRFLNRTWRLIQKTADSLHLAGGGAEGKAVAPREPKDPEFRRHSHEAIRRVTRALEESLHFNTAVAALMEYSNYLSGVLQEGSAVWGDRPGIVWSLRVFVQLLHPFAPHMSEELWRDLGEQGSLLQQGWPEWDPAALSRKQVSLVITVNGKVRSRVEVASGLAEAEARERALSDPKVRKILGSRSPRRVVVVPDRLVNIVL